LYINGDPIQAYIGALYVKRATIRLIACCISLIRTELDGDRLSGSSIQETLAGIIPNSCQAHRPGTTSNKPVAMAAALFTIVATQVTALKNIATTRPRRFSGTP
jgi:hypothetical protein